MRRRLPSLFVVLCPIVVVFLTVMPDVQALAQVTVDLHALDAPPTPKAPGGATSGETPGQAPSRKPVPHRAPHRTATRSPAKTQGNGTPPGTTTPATTTPATTTPATTKPGAAAPSVGSAAPAPSKPIPPAAPANPAAAAAPPVVGLTPPPIAVIPPPPAADAPMAPVPPPTISDTAATSVDTLPSKDGTGVRLDFAHGEADLTQGTANAVKALVAATPKDDTTTFNVMAYATGVPEDPSTARRLSLSRALSVRSALMAYGVPSTHIYVRALGAALPGDGPSDRVDVMVMGANAAVPPPGAASAAPPADPPADAATRTP